MSAEAGPRRLLLVRHGRTTWNAERRAQGHADVELDETGHAQAAAVATALAALGPAALWSSDLVRAQQTTAYVEKETGLVATLDPRLREYALGDNRVGLTIEQYAEQHPAEHALLRAGRGGEIRGRETPEDVLARWRPALDRVIGAIGPGETHVVVAHGAAIRTALTDLLGWPLGNRDDLVELANCARVEAVSAARTDAGRWRLAAYNLGV